MMTFSRCKAAVLPGESSAAVYLFLPPEQAEELQALLPMPRPALVALYDLDWNADLSPWPAEKVFRGGEDFAGRADAFLQELTEEIIPAVETVPCARRILAGYSLGGLFAVYAGLNTDAFHRIASVSGSMWYDGFADYALARPCLADMAYMSLGDKEKHTRNRRMACIEEASRTVAAHLGCPLVMNPGGHFDDELPRLARAVAALV